jgi:wyosine [tRNA(Phe)-imidazoG37] synthetase (radical SAM superfamily)/ActR/RegA family two-component response regulator
MSDVKVIDHGLVPVAEDHIWNSKNKVVYGPVISRRLRYSLGINFFPVFKVCSFNCAYCDMGKTPASLIRKIEFQKGVVSGKQLVEEITKSLKFHKAKGTLIDYITICGNGEATLHPDFVCMTESIIRLRDKIFPGKPLAILTNSWSVNYARISVVIDKLDEKIYKLDAGDEKTFRKVARPILKESCFDDIVNGLSKLRNIKISSAVVDAPRYSNIDSLQGPFVEIMKRIQPDEIQLHNIDYPVFENDDTIRRLGVEDLIELGYYINVHTEIPVRIAHSPISLRDIGREAHIETYPRRNILILDDMPDYLRSLERALRRDFNIIVATSIEEAKAKVNGNIHAALIDVRLKQNDKQDTSGLKFLSFLKKSHPEIKTIMMTAYSSMILRNQAVENDADRFIAKPMNISQLKTVLHELCK